ncbi:MAG: M48 family metalloprotease [Beijerinckiaceae bacterium]
MLALVLPLVLAGCVALEPAKPEVQAGPVSLPLNAPRVSGVENGDERLHAQLLAAYGGAYRNAKIEQQLAAIVRRIGAASDVPGLDFRVTILNNQAINAFALPSGRIYLTRGLLALANDTAEVAGVVAHEVAHVTANHSRARSDVEAQGDLISRVSTQLLNDPQRGAQAKAHSRLTLASFSRQQELDADEIGVRALTKAGYDPYGAVRFLQSLGRHQSLRNSSTGKVDFLATHPTTPERINRAMATARQMGAPGQGERDRESWLQAIDGMAYGEEQADGFVRGRRYLHPVLGVAFTAPEGFTLEGSGTAVIGRNGSGTQAMRFDRVSLDAGQSLEAYLNGGLLDGVTMQDIEATTVSGFPAASGIGRAKDWQYRIGVIRSGQTVYRLLYSAQELTPQADRAFLASFQSFRRLEGEEAAQARQSRIALVRSSGGDSDVLAGRMTGDAERALERFLVLNGLASAAEVRAGSAYKVVAE